MKIPNIPIARIGLDQFETKVMKEKKPVLLACMDQGIGFYDQIRVLEGIQMSHGQNLRVFILYQDSLEAFADTFEMEGTPTFFLFEKGKIVNRFLGKAKLEDLDRFLFPALFPGANQGGA